MGALVDCLYGIYDGKAGIDILDKYDQLRREVYHTATDPISTTNLERIQKDPESVVGGKDPFFALLDAAKEDPGFYEQLERVRPFLLSVYFRSDRSADSHRES